MITGVVILASRRLIIPRVRATTAPVDYVALILLLIIILTGIAPTIFVNLLGHGYDYRTTVAPWFRGLFSGSPDVSVMASVPVIYQVHVTAAWVIWAVWPFSRLVHAWSYPLWYLWRPYVVYRRRRAVPATEPGAGGASGGGSASRTDTPGGSRPAMAGPLACRLTCSFSPGLELRERRARGTARGPVPADRGLGYPRLPRPRPRSDSGRA